MLCQRCKERPANVQITKLINGEKIQEQLCEVCAQSQNEFGYGFNINFPSFLANLFDMSFGTIAKDFHDKTHTHPEQQCCEHCKMSLIEFRKKGKFGCIHCYGTFKQFIDGLFKKLHGNTQHTGKVPQRAGAHLKIKRRLSQLKESLNDAIQKEEYELAAKLRDEIKDIERGNNI